LISEFENPIDLSSIFEISCNRESVNSSLKIIHFDDEYLKLASFELDDVISILDGTASDTINDSLPDIT
jgi:hypothetical protein